MKYYTLFCFYFMLSIEVFGKDLRIVGGSNADIREFPYLVSFRYVTENILFCSGMIISERHILTAAHCLFSHQDVYHLLRIYTVLNPPQIIEGPTYRINEVIYHPDFTGKMIPQSMNVNDIAVVKTQGSMIFNEFVNKLDLLTIKPEDGIECTMSGWGTIMFPTDLLPENLQKLDMRIVPRDLCSSVLPFTLHDGQICGYKLKGFGSCNGDSGGPLICDNKLVGIISFNLPCAQGFPDVFTNVQYYSQFITSAMRD